jgi:hypothetical protein
MCWFNDQPGVVGKRKLLSLKHHSTTHPQDDAERDLAAAKPALDDALAALNQIRPADITSLKALKSPPDIVKRIFDCVLLLRYWPISPVRKGRGWWLSIVNASTVYATTRLWCWRVSLGYHTHRRVNQIP